VLDVIVLDTQSPCFLEKFNFKEMISNSYLMGVVQAVEVAADRDFDSLYSRKSSGFFVDKGSASSIISYLLRPYENGYWELKASWKYSSLLTNYLLDEVGILKEFEDEIGERKLSPNGLIRKLSEGDREALVSVSARLSSINRLFQKNLISKGDSGKGVELAPEDEPWMKEIDFSVFSDKFKDAVNIFSSEIYFDGFRSLIDANGLFRLKSGVVSVLSGPSRLLKYSP